MTSHPRCVTLGRPNETSVYCHLGGIAVRVWYEGRRVVMPISSHALIGFQGRGIRECRILMPSHVSPPDRSPTLQVNIKNLTDKVQCYQTVRELRWPDGIAAPRVSLNRSLSVVLMIRNRHVSVMSVATVTHALMIGDATLRPVVRRS